MRDHIIQATTGTLAAMRYLADKKPNKYTISVSESGVWLMERGRMVGYHYDPGHQWFAPWGNSAPMPPTPPKSRIITECGRDITDHIEREAGTK